MLCIRGWREKRARSGCKFVANFYFRCFSAEPPRRHRLLLTAAIIACLLNRCCQLRNHTADHKKCAKDVGVNLEGKSRILWEGEQLGLVTNCELFFALIEVFLPSHQHGSPLFICELQKSSTRVSLLHFHERKHYS
jgi:hypothetical protein